jgi:hypothetical protein
VTAREAFRALVLALVVVVGLDPRVPLFAR